MYYMCTPAERLGARSTGAGGCVRALSEKHAAAASQVAELKEKLQQAEGSKAEQIKSLEESKAAALEIACRTEKTVYDSVYLALAANHDCRLVTADRRLYNALQKSPLNTSVLWAGDIQSG